MEPKRSIIDYLAWHAERDPERAAILHRERSLSYAELEALAARCRGALRGLGVGPGDRVALVMSDGPAMVAALLGIMGASAIAVPCSTLLKAADLAYQFNDCGCRVALATPEFASVALEARAFAPGVEQCAVAGGGALAGALDFDALLAAAEPAPLGAFTAETPNLILYTSGSTGLPKGAVHRHGDLAWSVESVALGAYGLQPDDRLFSAPRLFFAYGHGNSFFLPIGAGCTAILCSERPTPEIIASYLEKYRPTVLFGVPTGYRMLLEHLRQGHAFDTRSLRFCGSAGEPLPQATWNEWKAATGTEILESLGTTEMLNAFLCNPRGRVRPGSSGVPLPGYEARLVDEDGAVVQGAGRGLLQVRGGSMTTGYWNNPAKTAEAIRDGWLRTGDVYRRDADGYYWFEGRGDDLFKCSGMWVSPGEVEDAVCSHPAVLEAAVVAARDDAGGTIPAAYVALRPGREPGDALAAEIAAHAAGVLPRFKRPRRIQFVEQLPRTATGKVQRFRLREMANARA